MCRPTPGEGVFTRRIPKMSASDVNDFVSFDCASVLSRKTPELQAFWLFGISRIPILDTHMKSTKHKSSGSHFENVIFWGAGRASSKFDNVLFGGAGRACSNLCGEGK